MSQKTRFFADGILMAYHRSPRTLSITGSIAIDAETITRATTFHYARHIVCNKLYKSSARFYTNRVRSASSGKYPEVWWVVHIPLHRRVNRLPTYPFAAIAAQLLTLLCGSSDRGDLNVSGTVESAITTNRILDVTLNPFYFLHSNPTFLRSPRTPHPRQDC